MTKETKGLFLEEKNSAQTSKGREQTQSCRVSGAGCQISQIRWPLYANVCIIFNIFSYFGKCQRLSSDNVTRRWPNLFSFAHAAAGLWPSSTSCRSSLYRAIFSFGGFLLSFFSFRFLFPLTFPSSLLPLSRPSCSRLSLVSDAKSQWSCTPIQALLFKHLKHNKLTRMRINPRVAAVDRSGKYQPDAALPCLPFAIFWRRRIALPVHFCCSGLEGVEGWSGFWASLRAVGTIKGLTVTSN